MVKSIHQGFIRLSIPSDTGYLHMISTLTQNTSRLAGFSKKIGAEVALAVDEAVTNVIQHSYHGNQKHEIRLSYEITHEHLRIDIRHAGDQVNLKKVKAPDLKRYIAERRKGGLGLVLMKKLMDRVEFDQEGGKVHECCMWKYRKAAPRSERPVTSHPKKK